MTQHYVPRAVFDGETLHTCAGLTVEDGHVTEVTAAPHPGATPLDALVTPGFVDLQVNGGGGVLVNAEPTPDGLAAIAAAHRRLGTRAILPTVITDAPGVMERAAEAALARPAGTLGLHIEGPHIAEARRGTHAAEHIRPLDQTTHLVVEKLRAADIPVLITLAPEAASPEGIARLAATGAIVSLGHSGATAEATRAALAAGARCVTHLFNAMSQMTGRDPGMVGAAIGSGAACGIICDGHHVADEMVALAIRARPRPDSTFLVSDAMPTVGGPDRFTLYGAEIAVRDGRLVNAEGRLAGAHTTMAEGVARLVGPVGLPAEQALRMAVTTPARLIGRPDLARILGTPVTDLLRLGPDMSPLGWGLDPA